MTVSETFVGKESILCITLKDTMFTDETGTFNYGLNSLPSDNMLHWPRLTAFVDDSLNGTQVMEFVFLMG